jgi:glycosyltransferase involved in cell wall biosynthesis
MLPISVIIPVYNRRALLRAALESVADQTMLPAEVIVVDDGSQEPVADIAEAFGAKVISQENSGPSAARNRGIAAASQDWIAFLDSDDLWVPEKLERQWRVVETHPIELCFSDMIVVGDAGTMTRSALRPLDPSPNTHVSDIRDAYALARSQPPCGEVLICTPERLRTALARYNMIFPSTLLIRRQAALDVGGFVPELRVCEDWDFVLRLSARRTSAAAVELPLVRYHLHDANISGNFVRAAQYIVKMIDRSVVHPDEYPRELYARWQEYFPKYVTLAAYVAWREGRFEAAHEFFSKRLQRTPSVPALLWLSLATMLDTPLGHRLYGTARFFYEMI